MFKKLFRKTPLAWLQLKREKTRFVVALAGIAFADLLMFFQLGLIDALFDSVAKPYSVLKGDLFIINRLFESLNVVRSFPRSDLYRAAGIEGVEGINYLYVAQGEWRNPHNKTNQTALVFGINPSNPAIALTEVETRSQDLKLLDVVLYDRTGRENLFGNVSELLQKSNPLSIQFNGLQIKVVDTFVLGASFAADGNLIASHSTFLRLFPQRQPDKIDIGVIQLKPESDVARIQATLQATLGQDVLILNRDEFIAHEKKYWEVNSPISFIFSFGAIIGFIVGLAIVYQILYSDVSDHLPEYATLKAMGYSDRYLIGLLIQESLILAILGFLPGFLLSSGLYYLAASATYLPIYMTFHRAAIVLALTIIMCVASGGIAMRKLQAADPADIF
jgi:putative ABC transport system permease protein